MKLVGERDRVVAAIATPLEGDAWLWFMTAEGLAGRTDLAEFPRYRRGARGVLTLRLPADSHGLGAAALGGERDQLLVLSDAGRGRIVHLGKATTLKRGAGKPTEAVNLRDREKVAGVLRLT